MKMRNIEIEVLRENYIVVRADTERFGENEVMFEGNTFEQCFDYIKRETEQDNLRLSTRLCYGIYMDRDGRGFPPYMQVV